MKRKIASMGAGLLFLLVLQPTGAAELRSTGIGSIRIQGSSSLHKWQMHSSQIKGGVRIDSGGISSVDALLQRLSRNSIAIHGGFVIPVFSLQSAKSAMDAKAYAALQQKRHPLIRIRLRGYRFLSHSKGQYLLRVTVRVIIAQKGRTLSLPIRLWRQRAANSAKSSPQRGTRRGKRQILHFATEEQPLRMSDFGIRPPQAMLGLLRTEDRVRVKVCGKLTWHP